MFITTILSSFKRLFQRSYTINLRLSDLQEYLKKQYDVVFDRLQSYYNLLKEAGITWKKTQKINPAKNDELVKAKKKLGRNY